MKRIAIIGGGIAGLACALHLDQSNFEITIFDKGRGRGGRVATQRFDDFQFDHGAQYIEETDSPFMLELEEWMNRGIIKEWDATLGELQGSRFLNTFKDKRVFVGTPTMSRIGNYLAEQLDYASFELNTEIVEVFKKFNEWYLVDSDEQIHGGYDFLVCTIPAPQAKELLQEFPYIDQILSEVEYSPRWAVMIGLKHRLNVDYDGIFVSHMRRDPEAPSPIRWLARNNSKPDRPEAESWIVHASHKWSKKYLEKDPEWVAKKLYQEFLDVTGFEKYQTNLTVAHRWRYAIINKSLNQNFILDNNRNIALAGDFCTGKNIEAAYISGETLGERLNSLRI